MMRKYVFSAPGRTEISGNHTDHQHGCVLAASVNLKTTARVTLNDDGTATSPFAQSTSPSFRPAMSDRLSPRAVPSMSIA